MMLLTLTTALLMMLLTLTTALLMGLLTLPVRHRILHPGCGSGRRVARLRRWRRQGSVTFQQALLEPLCRVRRESRLA